MGGELSVLNGRTRFIRQRCKTVKISVEVYLLGQTSEFGVIQAAQDIVSFVVRRDEEGDCCTVRG